MVQFHQLHLMLIGAIWISSMQIITSHKSCSRVRQYIHVIEPSEPHHQSLAALLLIKNEYMLLDPEANPHISWKIYKRRRSQLIKEHFIQYGKYICIYCKRDDLTTEVKQSDPRRLTIDHIVPLCRGGSLTSKSNMAICCSKCNNEKGSSLIE